jgi:hypothetical protein
VARAPLRRLVRWRYVVATPLCASVGCGCIPVVAVVGTGVGIGASHALMKTVSSVLLHEGLHVVALPRHLRELLMECGASTLQATPSFVRKHFRLPESEWRNFALDELRARFPSLNSVSLALDVLYFCLSDLQGQCLDERRCGGLLCEVARLCALFVL